MNFKHIVNLREESLNLRFKTKDEEKIKPKNFFKKIEAVLFSIPIWGQIFKRYNESLKITEKSFDFKNLPESFDKFKILFISDFHLDIEPNALREFIKRRIPEYDLVLLGGDYFDNPENTKKNKLEYLKSKMKKPIYSVFGNHDDFMQIKKYEDVGINILFNESIRIERDDQYIVLTGVDEIVHNDNGLQDKVMDETKKIEKAFSILLSHSPDILERASSRKYDLQLSGHTHGGQFLINKKAMYINTEYEKALKGEWKDNEMKGYTTTGFGNSGYPIRNITPEIVVITLNKCS
jgi:predicted MPP superfamily phosphohydrolase